MARATAARLTPSRPPPHSPRPQQRQDQDHRRRRRRRPRIIALRTSSRSGAPHGRSYTPRRHIIRTTRRRRSAHRCYSSCTRSRNSTRARTARTTSARACVVVRRTCARARGSVRGFARRTTRSTRCSGSQRLIVRAWMSGGGMGPAMGAVIRAGAGSDFVYSISDFSLSLHSVAFTALPACIPTYTRNNHHSLHRLIHVHALKIPHKISFSPVSTFTAYPCKPCRDRAARHGP